MTDAERKAKLTEIFAKRAEAGHMPKNDSALYQPELVELLEDGLLILKFPVLEWQCNGLGNIQGGQISSMIDLAFGAYSYVLADCSPAATVDMTTNYIRGVSPADKFLIIETHFPNRGRRILHGESKVYTEQRKLVATASTNIIRLT